MDAGVEVAEGALDNIISRCGAHGALHAICWFVISVTVLVAAVKRGGHCIHPMRNISGSPTKGSSLGAVGNMTTGLGTSFAFLKMQ
jgi:hypothetical protein